MYAGGAVFGVGSVSLFVGALTGGMASDGHGFKTGSTPSPIREFAAVVWFAGLEFF